jgi:lysophosphatidate acyltransferase
MMSMISDNLIISILLWILLGVSTVVFLAAVASVFQEQKIWKSPKLPSLTAIGLLKVFLLNLCWMGCCVIGSILTVVYCLVTSSSLKNSRDFAHTKVERYVAQFVCHCLVGPVEVRGTENLPAENCASPAPILIANHDSQIDLAAVYFFNRQWRWIAKSSVMILPGVGQIMWLSGHVFIDRRPKKNNNSKTGARNLYVQSNASIQSGVPMFFFPQGTRRLGERLPFKDGAFKVAKENDSKIIPISIEIPLTAWNSTYPFLGKADPVIITVHKAMESKGKDIETLKKESFETIYSVLPDYTKQS